MTLQEELQRIFILLWVAIIFQVIFSVSILAFHRQTLSRIEEYVYARKETPNYSIMLKDKAPVLFHELYFKKN